MALIKRGNIYHFQFELNGQRHRGSTKRTNLQAARAVESALRLRLLNAIQGVPERVDVPTFAKIADQFLEFAETNLANATLSLHRVNVKDLKRFFKGKLVNQIDRLGVESFKKWRAKQKRKNGEGKISRATTNRSLTTLKRIYNYYDSVSPVAIRNPVKHVPFFKEEGRVRVLTVEEAENYVDNAKGDLKDYAVLALSTGGRPAEILKIHQRDCHLEEGYVTLQGTKTEGSWRDVPLMTEAEEVLERRISKSSNGFIFPTRRPRTVNKDIHHATSIRKAHDNLVEKYFSDDPFTLYVFRHTFATRCVQAGVELPVLSSLLGHTGLEMTMRYVHAGKRTKVEATEKLQVYLETARRAKQLQDANAGSRTDEWGAPIPDDESDARYPQNPPQSVDFEFIDEAIKHLK